jgi:hypothetical protein
MDATVVVADRAGDTGDPPTGDAVRLDAAELDRQRIRFDGYFSGPTW